MAGSLRADPRFRVLAAICVFAVAVGIANVVDYDPGQGYDALDHQAYADLLVPGGHLPHGTGEYYTPPGFYALAGSADWVGSKLLGMGEPHRAGSALNVLYVLATILLVWKIARELWPGRDRIAIGAAAFVALLPVTVKTEAMFHPETLSLLTCTLGLWLCVRTFASPHYAYALGVALGLAQLVRAWSLLTVVCVAVALAVGRRRRELAIVLAIAALIPAPWYLHQAITYHGNPVFPRPPTKLAQTAQGEAKPIWERRPWRFYVDPGVPTVITRPYQPHFDNLAIPTTYTELWGDYFGVWVWELKKAFVPPPGPVRAELVVQAVAGLVPTLLAVVGWALFLRASLRSPSRLAVALLPLVGLLGYLFFAVSYPTAVGDVLKATYMLSTAGAWALGFGFALERLRGRLQPFVFAALAACAVAELPFLLLIAY